VSRPVKDDRELLDIQALRLAVADHVDVIRLRQKAVKMDMQSFLEAEQAADKLERMGQALKRLLYRVKDRNRKRKGGK
jgi:hypothetical protein